MASLRYPPGTISHNKEDLSGLHFCGGALVAENVVLTAAHCVHIRQIRTPPVHINRFHREIGDQHEEFQTVETRIHPSYRASHGRQNHDVALLVLNNKSKIAPVDLAANEQCFENNQCGPGTVLGWGYTRQGDRSSQSDPLLEVQVPLVSRSACRALYQPNDPSSTSTITDFMVCAGEEDKDACQADSGGPLLVNGVVAGVVSWGRGCGEVPGVYSNVAKLRDWIQEQLTDIHNKVLPQLSPTCV